MWAVAHLSRGGLRGAGQRASVGAVATALLAVGILVRIFVLPRFPSAQSRLVAMIIGMSIIEGANFVQLFAIPDEFPLTRLIIFICTIVGMVLYLPIYALDVEAPGSGKFSSPTPTSYNRG